MAGDSNKPVAISPEAGEYVLVVGHKDSFAFSIGLGNNRGMRMIDVFVGGTNVCPKDNSAYVPQFRESIQVDLSKLKQLHSTKYQEYFSDLTPEKAHRQFKRFHDVGEPVEWIEGDALHEHFRFLDWGPTTDDVQSFLIPSEGTAYLTYEFWRPEHPRSGRVEAVEIAIPELIETLADMLNKLAPE